MDGEVNNPTARIARDVKQDIENIQDRQTQEIDRQTQEIDRQTQEIDKQDRRDRRPGTLKGVSRDKEG